MQPLPCASCHPDHPEHPGRSCLVFPLFRPSPAQREPEWLMTALHCRRFRPCSETVDGMCHGQSKTKSPAEGNSAGNEIWFCAGERAKLKAPSWLSNLGKEGGKAEESPGSGRKKCRLIAIALICKAIFAFFQWSVAEEENKRNSWRCGSEKRVLIMTTAPSSLTGQLKPPAQTFRPPRKYKYQVRTPAHSELGVCDVVWVARDKWKMCRAY